MYAALLAENTIILSYHYNRFCCRYDQEGNEEENPIFPFRITLQPTGEVNFKEEWSPIDEFLQQFKDNIPAGANIYSFITHENPDDEVGTELAQLKVVDGCFPSKYGDKHLFFQHQSAWEDAKLRPEWESDYKTGCIGCTNCGPAGSVGPNIAQLPNNKTLTNNI